MASRAEPSAGSSIRGPWPTPIEHDPVTGLLSFPCFREGFVAYLPDHLTMGRPVGIAVGDVDDLKGYIRHRDPSDPLRFGHLAGNALMARLGRSALRWLGSSPVRSAALSTFGGDEIILVASGISRPDFDAEVRSLAERLRRELPRPVSFAYGWFCPGDAPPAPGQPFREPSLGAVSLVDRALLRSKARRQSGAEPRDRRVTVMRTRRYDPVLGWPVTREIPPRGESEGAGPAARTPRPGAPRRRR